MTLFELVGSIFIKNEEANSKIDDTSKKAKDMASKVGGAMQTAGDKITKVGKTLAPVSAVVGGALGVSIKSASDFTDGMAKMSTLVDTSKTSLSDLSNEFLSLSNKTGLSATELAEAGYQALSAGVDVNNAVGFVETAGNLAKAGFTSTTTAVDILTTAINAYGEEAGTADEISNKLVRTQNLGKTTVDELASSMGRIIPTASAMGVDINNLSSGYVSLTKQGIATAEATTYMNSMLNELGDSGTDVGGILKKKTGKSFQELMASGYSLGDVLQIVQKYSKDAKINFNELWGSSEAGKSALAILNGGVEEFNSTVETMKSDTDDVGDALDKLDTPSRKVKESLNQVKNSGIQLGTSFITSLIPTIDKIAVGVEKVTTWFSSLDDGTRTTIATVMLLIAGLSPVLIVGGKIIHGIGTFITYIPTIQGALTTISTGFKAVWGVLMANPIMLIVGLIAGLVAGFIYLWNTSEEFRNFWIGAWNTIKSAVSTAIATIKTVASNGLNHIRTVVTNVMNSVKSTFSNAWNTVRTKVSTSISSVKSTISSGLNTAYSTVSSVLGNIKEKFSSIMESAKSTVHNAIEAIKSKFNFTWSLPKLKLPHISIDGKFSLNPPSVPHFSIDWYKKAMDNPLLFTKPTLFNVNPLTGTAKGAGEAGDEVMIGKDTMLNMMRQAVSAENERLLEILEAGINKIFEILQEYMPELATRELVLDTGAVVGGLAPQMDAEFGKIITHKGRGN